MFVKSWVFGGFWGLGDGAIHGYATYSVCQNYDLFVNLVPGSVVWLWAFICLFSYVRLLSSYQQCYDHIYTCRWSSSMAWCEILLVFPVWILGTAVWWPLSECPIYHVVVSCCLGRELWNLWHWDS